MKGTSPTNGLTQTDRLSESVEIIANLWYVMDDQGFIYSLRIKLYVCEGTDIEKLSFLKSRAYFDYLIGHPFTVPARFNTNFIDGNGSEAKYAVIHHDVAISLGGIDQLFFDGLDELQKKLPTQTRLSIPESPLIKVTALVGEGNGNIVPLDVLSI